MTASERAPRHLFVLPESEPYNPRTGGAIATFTQAMARELAAAGRPAAVVSPRFSGASYPDGDVAQLPTVGEPGSALRHTTSRVLGRLRPGRFGRRARYLRETLPHIRAAGAATVVIANDPSLATLASRNHAGPTVLWLHNYLRGPQAEQLRELPPTVEVVTVSESVREWTGNRCGISPDAITVIHNGIDHAEFHPAARRAPHDRLRIVFSGRIDPNKGQLLGAEAVVQARDRHGVDVDLTVIGGLKAFDSSPDQAQQYDRDLRRTVAAAGGTIAGHIPATAMPETLRDFDVALILPLVPEPFGLTAVEALASGCAVIAIPSGGVAEVVGDAAVLVPPDASAIADAIARLAGSPDLLAEYRSRAHERSLRFSWRKAAADLEALIAARSGRDG